MRHIATISGLIIIGMASATTPAPAETSRNPPIRWTFGATFKRVGATTFNDFLRAPKVWFSKTEIQQIASKVGMPLDDGYFTVGYIGARRKNIQSVQISNTVSSPQAIAQSDPDNNRGPSIRKTSPSALDISGEPPGTRRVVREEGDTYDPVLRRRALELYPSDRQARLLWMAAQEQQAIQNQINNSKPLIYPVGNR
jgi:hypothetical protein